MHTPAYNDQPIKEWQKLYIAATVWGYADTDFEAEKELLEAIDWESLIVDDNH